MPLDRCPCVLEYRLGLMEAAPAFLALTRHSDLDLSELTWKLLSNSLKQDSVMWHCEGLTCYTWLEVWMMDFSFILWINSFAAVHDEYWFSDWFCITQKLQIVVDKNYISQIWMLEIFNVDIYYIWFWFFFSFFLLVLWILLVLWDAWRFFFVILFLYQIFE